MTDPTHDPETLQGVAVIGLAARFPGAASAAELWCNLRDGVESISFFSAEELAAAGFDPAVLADPRFVPAKGALAGADLFDAGFFGLTPREAEHMDPQHRVFLECAWEALEDAGCDPKRPPGRIGLFAGSGASTYLLSNLLPHAGGPGGPGGPGGLGDMQAMLLNDRDFLATRVSYELDLKGPSFVVQTACSTSLSAVHLACQSLLSGECDVALAGGVSIAMPLASGYLWEEGSVLSPDGHCRAFDAQAGGSVPGDGCGVVVLKRLADALADGDAIHAVIRGSAANNDGSAKVGYTAPSVEGQAEVIRESLLMAGVDPASIRYIETHGSGTVLGDPIEIAALHQAFADAGAAPGSIALGSVKTNLGHCNAAAGVAGLIKTVLALEHGTVPPSLHFAQPNPQIPFTDGPFYVAAGAAPWPETAEPHRAGVSSFGIGGTNVHAVLEEAPAAEPGDAPARPWQLLVLSARSEAALEQAAGRLAKYFETQPETDSTALADTAWTLQTGRRAFDHRRIVVARDAAGAVAELRSVRAQTGRREGRRPVVFLLPGLGDQYAGMARGLYEGEPAFRAAFDLCAERLNRWLDRDLREVLFTGAEEPASGSDLRALLRRAPEPASDSPLHRTVYAQPACFAVEYALAQLLASWGIEPEAMIGYSVGEYVAACLSGALPLDAALELVAKRARLIEELPGGAMLAIPLSEAETRPFLGQLSVAATNGPHMTVVAGAPEAVDELERRLTANGVSTIRLRTTHAFHAAEMAPAVPALTEIARSLAARTGAPRIPYLSNVTGDWVTAEDLADPGYWPRHMQGTVRFAEGVAKLLKEPGRIFLELGPGGSLGALLRQHPDAPAGLVAVPALPRAGEAESDVRHLLEAVGRLWIAGAEIDWTGLHGGDRRHRVHLPTYPFERQRCWIDPPAPGTRQETSPSSSSDLRDWFWTPVWSQAPRPRTAPEGGPWLLFLDRCGLGERAAARLRSQGETVITVNPGELFTAGEDAFTLDPARRPDYDALIEALRSAERLPRRILHLWGVTDQEPSDHEALQSGLVSLLLLGQSLAASGALPSDSPMVLAAVANGLAEVLDGDPVHPAKAAALGLLKVLGQENPGLSCLAIDVPVPADDRLLDHLLAETAGPVRDAVVAFRGRQRWARSYAPVPLDAPTTPALRPGSTYLITDGTHGPGMAIAEHLVRAVNANVVLLVPPQFPPRDRWETWKTLPEVPPGQDVIGNTIGRLLLLERDSLLDRIRLVRAAVTDDPALRAALSNVQGVFHTAGAFTGGLALLKSPEALLSALDPALRGARTLFSILGAGEPGGGWPEQATGRAAFQAPEGAAQGQTAPRREGGHRPAFLLLSSSTLAVAGGLGQLDHAAAGCFLEALAACLSSANLPIVAAHWDPYQWGGWLAGAAGAAAGISPEEIAANQQAFGVPLPASAEALERLLASGLPACAVSSRDLDSLIQETDALSTQALAGQVGQGPRESHPRPGLSVPYAPPRNPLEERLAALWQELFGIAPIGIDDSFLELGGHSLLAIQMATQLRARFQADLPVTALFEAPTISQLAKQVRRARGEDDPEDLEALLALVEGLSPEEAAAKLAEMGV